MSPQVSGTLSGHTAETPVITVLEDLNLCSLLKVQESPPVGTPSTQAQATGMITSNRAGIIKETRPQEILGK